MTKEELRRLVTEYGDAIIHYKSQNSKKIKYNVCTLDFDVPYIQTKKNRAEETHDTLMFYCWDTDGYRLLKPANVIKVEPLSSVLQNGKQF